MFCVVVCLLSVLFVYTWVGVGGFRLLLFFSMLLGCGMDRSTGRHSRVHGGSERARSSEIRHRHDMYRGGRKAHRRSYP